MVASYNEVGSIYPSAIFWNCLRRIGVSSSLHVWQISPIKPSGSELLFPGRFLITVSIPLLVTAYAYVCALLCRAFVTPWTVAHRALLSMGFFRQEYRTRLPFSPPGESSWPRDRIRVSYVSWIGRRILYQYHHLGSPYLWFVCSDFPIASCCLCRANSSPLPRVTFLTPCFSIWPHQHWQLLLSCWGAQGRFWRRLWHGWATWAPSVVKGDFGGGGAQDPGTCKSGQRRPWLEQHMSLLSWEGIFLLTPILLGTRYISGV